MMTRFNVLKIKIQQLKSTVEQRAASEVRRELVPRHSCLAPGSLRYISHCESYHLIRGNCCAVGRDLHTECNMFILSTFQSRAADYKVTARSRLSRYRSKLSQRVNYFTADLCRCKAAVNPAASDSKHGRGVLRQIRPQPNIYNLPSSGNSFGQIGGNKYVDNHQQ